MSEQATRGWQRPSIYDVAKQAGVSHMTVSRVLNGHPNIRESTRERVLQAIDEMNYTRSSIARALATRRAMRIGVLVDSPVQYGPNSTLRALESAARDAGYAISAFSISRRRGVADRHRRRRARHPGRRRAVRHRARARRRSTLLRQQSTGLPTLVIKAEPDAEMHTAAVDQRAGAMLAVHAPDRARPPLDRALSGPLDWYDARAREQGWRDAARRRRGCPSTAARRRRLDVGLRLRVRQVPTTSAMRPRVRGQRPDGARPHARPVAAGAPRSRRHQRRRVRRPSRRPALPAAADDRPAGLRRARRARAAALIAAIEETPTPDSQ